MSTLYVNNIEPVSGSSLTLISASLVSVDSLSVVSLTSSFQGNLQGTASFATTASFALNSTQPGGTEGQIQFNSGSIFGADSNLFWDDTNKRLGIGTNAPSETLTLKFPNQTGWDMIFSGIGSNTHNIGGGNSLIINHPNVNIPSTVNMATASTSKMVNIGGTGLSARLGIKGSGTTSATTSLLVQNSAGSNLLTVTDDGDMNLNGGILSGLNVLKGASTIRIDSLGALGVIRFQGYQIGMGNNTIGDASALLTLTSTTKGFLPPRMTTTQKNAIATPAAGLMVYDTTLNQMSYYNGSSWVNF
jgi:hypothetical protein